MVLESISSQLRERYGEVLAEPDVKTRFFEDDGSIPNNPELPMVLLSGAVKDAGSNRVEALENLFEFHRWGGTWRNGIYSHHHYHSTAHEVLGIARGSGTVRLGGEAGETFELSAGDVVVLPAGTGHKNLGCSSDFLVVGGYPPGQSWDMNRGDPSERPEVLNHIRNVPLPETDPVYGTGGPLVYHWKKDSQESP